MKIERQLGDIVFRNSFGAFCYQAFEILHPGTRLIANWHIECVCYTVEQMATGKTRGRLVLNLPPRQLKSYLVSTCLPAWVLGRNPGARIICASYSEDLAHKFSRDCSA
jgi:hypothetical protein